jgi:hypothetical protein
VVGPIESQEGAYSWCGLLQEEGSHAMWEFSVNPHHHKTFNREMIILLLKGLCADSIVVSTIAPSPLSQRSLLWSERSLFLSERSRFVSERSLFWYERSLPQDVQSRDDHLAAQGLVR